MAELVQVAQRRAQHKEALWEEYVPCHCPGGCGDGCPCLADDHFCLKFCACSSACPHFFPGCICSGGCRTKICPCIAAGMTCWSLLLSGSNHHTVTASSITSHIPRLACCCPYLYSGKDRDALNDFKRQGMRLNKKVTMGRLSPALNPSVSASGCGWCLR